MPDEGVRSRRLVEVDASPRRRAELDEVAEVGEAVVRRAPRGEDEIHDVLLYLVFHTQSYGSKRFGLAIKHRLSIGLENIYLMSSTNRPVVFYMDRPGILLGYWLERLRRYIHRIPHY